MEKNRPLSIGLVVLLGIATTEAYAYFNLNSFNNVLIEENSALISQYDELNATYNQLIDSYQDINTTYNHLILLYESLNENHSHLEASFKDLASLHNLLNETYTDLSQNYTQLENTFAILESLHDELRLNYAQLNATYNELNQNYTSLETEYANLNSAYNTLNATHISYILAYQKLLSEVNFFVLHPKEDDESFITPDDQAIIDKVQEITGGWSDPSDWSEYWIDVKAMYDWVVNNIKYRYDGPYPILPLDPSSPMTLLEEMWQFPNQTLALGKGDCDDMAILLASMIYSYGSQKYFVECIWITAHLAVYIPVSGGNICILDPAGQYYTNSGPSSYSITQKDISTEVNAWLDYWDSMYPEHSPHVVYLVFSAYLYEYFGDTAAFINWLYDRV